MPLCRELHIECHTIGQEAFNEKYHVVGVHSHYHNGTKDEVDDASNVATSVAMSGDIAIDNAGATSIVSGVIINADVNASAAIVESKLAFNTGTGHNHDGVNSKLVSVGTATSIAQSCTIEAGTYDVTLSTTTQTTGASTLTIPDFAGANQTICTIAATIS